MLHVYIRELDTIDPSAGSGGLRQLSAGFSTTPRLLEPKAGLAQKPAAQNGPPNTIDAPWNAIGLTQLPSKRRPQ